MNLRHDVMADTTILDDERLDDERLDDVDPTMHDDELLADELAGIVELAAAFVASADGLASDFASFTYGIYSLGEMRADLWRLGAWVRGNA